MTKTKSTKRALLMSALALLMCVSMLIGSTFAWFTDSVTSGGNTIQSGTLKVDLVNAAGESLAGKQLTFKTADNRAQENILWEPGCTYEIEPVYVVNKGSLALKYQIVINGIDGDAKLLEAIEWSVKIGDEGNVDLATFEDYLETNGEKSEAIVLVGHMKEEANNDYQGLTAEGISITVYATQYTYENDSIDDQYDKDAIYADAYVTDADELADAIANAEDGDTIALMDDITVSDALIMNKSYNLDLNGHTLYLNTTEVSYIYRSSTVTFRNGTVDISKAVVPGQTGIFYFANGESGHADGNGAQGNTLTFDNVKLVGDGYSAYSVMTIRNGAEDKHNVLNFIDSTVELKNEARTDGGFIKHPGTTTSYAFVNIINTKIDCQNVTRLFLYGVYNIKDSIIDFIDTTGTSNGFRQGTFTIDNSKVTIKGGDKGISPRFADTVIKNGSVVTIENTTGNDVIFEYDFDILVDASSTFTYGTVSGTAGGEIINN